MLDTRYPGGKGLAGLHQWIVSQLPAALFYCEPFAGKGGVFRNKPPALRSWLNDDDPDVCDWWRRQSLPGVNVTCGDGIRILEIAADLGVVELLLYIDPPYLLRTRSKRRIYKTELTDEQHESILKACRRLQCAAAISGYPSEMYSDYLHDWHVEERDVITRGGVMRTESLWSNRAADSPDLAMKYSDLGDNFRERHRIDKRRRRWRAQFEAMPALESRALLLELIDAAHRRKRR